MLTPEWQLTSPIDAIIFDCDGTLSSIEGIDSLADENAIGKTVRDLTKKAMGQSGMNADVFEKRLQLVQPTQKQLENLANKYIDYQIPDGFYVIQAFLRLKKPIYIVSAGLLPTIVLFGNYLGFPTDHIYAVGVEFDKQGHYLDFDRDSPLVKKHGKRTIVNTLLKQHKTLAYIGDGLNDYETYDLVHRFIGFGGSYYRKNIERCCEFYIKILSLSGLLPLLLTQDESIQLTKEEKWIYQNGMDFIHNKKIVMNPYK